MKNSMPRERAVSAEKTDRKGTGEKNKNTDAKKRTEKIAFRPKRFTGPFWSGSDLSQIAVSLNNSVMSWSFGEYFTNHPDRSRYAECFPEEAIPHTTGIQVPAQPGSGPGNDQFAPMVFRLGQISYSGRYGGSLRLEFSQVLSSGYEYKKDGLLFDLYGLRLLIYLCPKCPQINALPITDNHASIAYELKYQRATAYPGGVASDILTDEQAGILDAALAAMAAEAARPGGPNRQANEYLRYFSFGFLRSTFPDYFSALIFITGIVLGDDSISFLTRAGVLQTQATVDIGLAMRRHGSDGKAHLAIESDTYQFRIDIKIYYGTERMETVRATLDGAASLVQFDIGKWTEAELPQEDVSIHISGCDIDFVTENDYFATTKKVIIGESERARIGSLYATATADEVAYGIEDIESEFIDGDESTAFGILNFVAIRLVRKVSVKKT